MPNNYIALVFPEYDDENNLLTSQDWKRNDLPDDKSLGNYIKYLRSYIDFFRDEECEMIYDAMNAAAFVYSLNIMDNYYPNRRREFMFALKNLENWRRNRVSSKDDVYVSKGKIIKDELRSEIACRMLHNSEDSYLLSVYIPSFIGTVWTLQNDIGLFKIESSRLSITTSLVWISSRHFPQRLYNWNPKHGENGKGAHLSNKGDDVAVLLCSREHAAEIMQKAIGVPMYDTLYCYDIECEKFMEFKADCKYEHLPSGATKRYYHSYHLRNISSIPNDVIKKLQILSDELNKNY